MVSRTMSICCLSLLNHQVYNASRRTLLPSRSASSIAIFMGQKIEKTTAYEWFRGKVRQKMIDKQMPDEDMQVVLGPDVVAAAFVIAWGGRVKVKGRNEWLEKRDKDYLPTEKDNSFMVEGIDTTGVKLLYESLGNFKNLQHLKYFKISKNDEADDFFLSNLFTTCRNIEFLEISDCANITERGVTCVHHLENLKCLKIKNLPGLLNIEIFTLLLEEMKPNCVVYVDEKTNRHFIKKALLNEQKEDSSRLQQHEQHIQMT